jgi:uncharacterized protein YndB with AHSA1/START domain
MTIHARSIENFACEDAVACRVVVALAPAATFEKFRHDISRWWPQDFTWSGDSLEDLYFEGRKGGVLWERGPEGFRCDMARVMRWVPPERMVLRWHIGPDHIPEPNPAKASEIEIKFFAEAGGRTRVELEHRGFSRHGAGAGEYRAFMGGAKGWPLMLKRFAEHCAPKVEGVPAGIANLRALVQSAAAGL